MSLQDILQKILDEAKLEVEAIKKSLDNQKAVLLEESIKAGAESNSVLLVKKKETIEKINLKVNSMARREVKQKMMVVRHEIVQKAISSFAQHLGNLPDDKYGEILKKLFMNISGKDVTIFVAQSRIDITKKHAPSSFNFEVDDSVKSGFVAKVGKSEIDNSFGNLVFSEFHNEIRSFFADKLGLI